MKIFKLEKLRENEDLKKKDIANKLNISNSIYSRWENNKSNIPTERLIQIANLFKVNIDYILDLTNSKIGIISNNEINKKIIGQRIKKIRENENLTLRNLAQILNTSSSTISAYETGKTLILECFLYEICKKYNYSSNWILGRSDEMFIKNK